MIGGGHRDPSTGWRCCGEGARRRVRARIPVRAEAATPPQTDDRHR
ncbi:hypothetical protein FM106_29410 [Brachybacterium faecium]|nr:hypothetical protein FM106_29410 [Brachybacterium faecium]